jgi:21S rRNA (GM2251-2'-O)-methyltransferase
MVRFLEQSAANGWRVIGTTLGERSKALRDVSIGQPTIVVLGNEGHGLRTLVERACSQLVNIEKAAGLAHGYAAEGHAGEGRVGVDSLNVAVTGGIVLYHLLA